MNSYVQQKAPVPPVRCAICNIQLSSQQVYNTHIEGKAHKKKILLQEREKARSKELEGQGISNIAIAAPLRCHVVKAIPISEESHSCVNEVAMDIIPSCSTTDAIVVTPPAKKRKKNKVICNSICASISKI